MAKYQQYEEYRNTHNQWLTEIPNHWSLVALKHILSVPMTDGPHETPGFVDEGVPFVSAEAVSSGKIDFKKIRGFITEVDDKRFSQKYKPQLYDVYMIKSGATTGVTAIVETEYDFNIWSPLAAMRCKKSYDPFFLLNYLRSSPFQKSVQLSWTFGTQQNIGMSTLENLPICVPPKLEQKKIADFLNYETAQIDTLIEKQQTLIQLLKEKRQAVISHAVTKGLNPDAPMKDSGVEWLGDVPEHWDIVKLKRLVSFSQGVQVDLGLQKHEEFDRSVKFLRIENYTQGSSDYRFINPILSQGKLVNRDELVMVRYGASAGYVGSGLEGALANNLFKISPTTNTITNNFLSSFLKNSYNYFQKEMSGSAMPALNFSMVEDLIITLPPIYEQKNIADYLDEIQNHFDYLTACAEQAIQLMQERRTALISAAVTGKIDVRGWRASE
ncbi:restriction endonuclease subunit S [Psychrobacter faecalis]|uniref:restriction endonuclease subunit S n=1 Tax=Psychrobacter faecalis TaxID=180588 RepID=UPI003FD3470A